MNSGVGVVIGGVMKYHSLVVKALLRLVLKSVGRRMSA
jgi:hypothetical protein